MFYFNHRYYYVSAYPHDIMLCRIIIIIIKARILLYYAKRTYTYSIGPIPTPTVFEYIILFYIYKYMSGAITFTRIKYKLENYSV